MINIYLVIILCALLLANSGFFCDHHSAAHKRENLPEKTSLQTNKPQEKNMLTALEGRLELLSQELTGISLAVNQLTNTVADHSRKLQSPDRNPSDVHSPRRANATECPGAITGPENRVLLTQTSAARFPPTAKPKIE